MNKRIFQIAFLVLGGTVWCMAQETNINNRQLPEMVRQRHRRELSLPTLNGYQTLACDFHIHTVFSDGIVWPTQRVEEAWVEGLDAIAITEHIENNPSKKYVGGDKNASFEIAAPYAKELGIMLIQAGEITRSMPPGHLNALFVEDVNKLDVSDPFSAIDAAKQQDAFIIWNHPGWKAQQPDTCLFMDYHENLLQKKMMHAIEVFNECEWYPVALDWCLEKNLAPIANSDIHGVAEYYYDYTKYMRPMTLVFVKEKNPSALKEALMAGRTVAFFANKLAGKAEYLDELFHSSVDVRPTAFEKDGKRRFLITNNSDVPYTLTGDINTTLSPRHSIAVMEKSGGIKNVIINNLFIGGNKNLSTILRFID